MSRHTSYLAAALTPAQQKRLDRKIVRSEKQQKKNTSIPDNIHHIHDRPEPKVILPKNDNQRKLMQILQDQKCEQIMIFGPAGVGKTFLTVSHAADMFNRGQIKKIVITRPNVGCGRTIGLLPGNLEEKMEVWLAETIHILKERLGESVYEIALKRGDIEMVALEHIRGRSFSNAFILVTEAQNTTVDEMTSIVTRIGENSKLVLDGDVRQTDLKQENGLKWAL
jgi:phosphate starvation-inducible PhoH-like protein